MLSSCDSLYILANRFACVKHFLISFLPYVLQGFSKALRQRQQFDTLPEGKGCVNSKMKLFQFFSKGRRTRREEAGGGSRQSPHGKVVEKSKSGLVEALEEFFLSTL